MSTFSVMYAGLLWVSVTVTIADSKTGRTEPASVQEASKVLDLRTFPIMEEAKVGNQRTLGMLNYEVKASSKAAFEFQRSQLAKLGFQEMPGGYHDENNQSGHFTKNHFVVSVSTYPSFGDPEKADWCNVMLVNRGNVDLSKLPVPPGVKPFLPNLNDASYTTTESVADTAASCRKLLLDAGWEPYGQSGLDGDQPDMSMQYFKRNAIKLQSWVSKTPVDGGKTMIRYSTDLLSADLPAPPDAKDPRYDDGNKKLDMDEPIAKTDAILAFYTERLPKMGWKATTEQPVVDSATKSQFLIFRNERKELLALDMKQYTDIVRVRLKHQTEAELAEEGRRAKEYAEKKRMEQMERNRKTTVTVPLPATARKIERPAPHRMQFVLATGTGPSTLEAFRASFSKEGWTEEKGARFDKNAGNLDLNKGNHSLSFRYFDIGFGNAEFTVSGSANVELEPVTAKGDEKPAETANKSPKSAQKPSRVPGLPNLPPGVEIPEEVGDLLKKARKEIDAAQPRKRP